MATNMQGDVTQIYKEDGSLSAEYVYDSFGVVIAVVDGNGKAILDQKSIGRMNSIRYRGYYYDQETGLYYLQSRYYDPANCRFINADDSSVLGLGQENVIEGNLFVYCLNNSINNYDPSGYWRVNISVNLAGTIIDFFIYVVIPYIATAHKATRCAKVLRFTKWRKKKYESLVKSLSKGIFNAMDRILYNLTGRAANAASRVMTKKALRGQIENWIGSVLNLSVGYAIATIIDRFDKDGKSGYVRF